AMGERQVTVGRQTYALPALFLVMATQNPIEQEGTFPLPEAQLDRFLMHVRVDYPDPGTEGEILRLARERARDGLRARVHEPAKMPQADVFAARAAVLDLHMAPAVERYVIELVLASRDPPAMTRNWRDASPGAPARAARLRWSAAPARAPGWRA